MDGNYLNDSPNVQDDEPTTFEETVIREGRALFLVISVLAGTIMFCIVMGSLGEFVPDNWGWLALAVTFICLPMAFDKLRQSPDPYIIQFARAFRIGFWSILMILQQLTHSQSLSPFHLPPKQSSGAKQRP